MVCGLIYLWIDDSGKATQKNEKKDKQKSWTNECGVD